MNRFNKSIQSLLEKAADSVRVSRWKTNSIPLKKFHFMYNGSLNNVFNEIYGLENEIEDMKDSFKTSNMQ